MIKAVLFFVIGAGAAYLYMNPGDVDGMLEMGKQGIHNRPRLYLSSGRNSIQ